MDLDRRRRHIINFIVAVIVALIGVVIILVSLTIKTAIEISIASSMLEPSDTVADDPTPEDPEPDYPGDIIVETKFIDLQPTLDQWLSSLSYGEEVGVMIYDINHSRTAASYQADKVFNVASVYKLLFAYDGYQQIALGIDDGDEHYTTTADKGDLTLYQCLDLIIRESYNGCADKLASEPTRVARVNGLISALEMNNTADHGLESTAADLTKLLRAYWRHTDLNQDLWNRLANSMLEQPPSLSNGELYDWRQGLPSGFTSKVQVYNKVGWDWNGKSWNIYADAAILDVVDDKHYYTMVVLGQNISDYKKFSQLGRMVEDAITLQTVDVIK